MSATDLNAPGRLLSFLDDLLNPIVVKEVRQALRGRYFRISFMVVLAAAMLACTGMIIDMGGQVSSREGRDFFLGIYVCLSVAVLGLVPFSAFHSMGAEWEENTFDLLVISNMRPRQILSGKLWSAGVQSLLYFSAFTPFLVFSFLLRGVDLIAVFVLLTGALIFSLAGSIVALFFSTLSRQRFVRIALMAALSGMLFFGVMGAGASAEELLRSPGQLRNNEFATVITSMLFLVGTVASFCFLAATNMLAHQEENRSTGLRILSVVVLALGMAYTAFMLFRFAERVALSVVSIMMVIGTMIPATFFCTEAEQLGRRVAPRVPAGSLSCKLASPFLPGGARGMMLYCLQLAGIVLFSSVGHFLMMGPGESWGSEGCFGVLIAATYALMYVGLPSAMFSRFTQSFKLRSLVRASVPLLIVAFAFGPALLGFFVRDRELVRLNHPGNPFHFIFSTSFETDGSWSNLLVTMLLSITGLVLLMNIPRVWKSFITLAEARRLRLARDAERLQATAD